MRYGVGSAINHRWRCVPESPLIMSLRNRRRADTDRPLARAAALTQPPLVRTTVHGRAAVAHHDAPLAPIHAARLGCVPPPARAPVRPRLTHQGALLISLLPSGVRQRCVRGSSEAYSPPRRAHHGPPRDAQPTGGRRCARASGPSRTLVNRRSISRGTMMREGKAGRPGATHEGQYTSTQEASIWSYAQASGLADRIRPRRHARNLSTPCSSG